VESRGVHYLVAREAPDGETAPTARAYRLPVGRRHPEGDERDTLLDELGLPIRKEATHVPQQWLALLPAGGPLAWRSFGLRGLGSRAPGAGSLGVPTAARVGDVLTTPDGSFLLTRDGPAELTEFALTVYRHVPTPRGRLAEGPSRPDGAPLELVVDDAPSVGRASEPYRAARWPASGLEPVRGPACAELTARVRAAPSVDVATSPEGRVGVASGRGAYVRSGGWGGRGAGPAFVVDATGTAYPLVGRESADRLGYGDTPAPVVPGSWLDLFERGVRLSVGAARSGVRPAGGS